MDIAVILLFGSFILLLLPSKLPIIPASCSEYKRKLLRFDYRLKEAVSSIMLLSDLRM